MIRLVICTHLLTCVHTLFSLYITFDCKAEMIAFREEKFFNILNSCKKT